MGADKLDVKEEALEEIKEQAPMRRWYQVNFCKRIRKMRDIFLHNTEQQFNHKLDLKSLTKKEVMKY